MYVVGGDDDDDDPECNVALIYSTYNQWSLSNPFCFVSFELTIFCQIRILFSLFGSDIDLVLLKGRIQFLFFSFLFLSLSIFCFYLSFV